MTKDGRPSLINNIRLFAGDRSRYLEGKEEAVAYGRRMAWLLNGEGFSLGAYPELYVVFTPSIEPGSLQLADDAGDWWHPYVHVGVAEDFADAPDALDVITNGIVKALIAIKPDKEDTIRKADVVVRENGRDLRFLLKRRDMAKIFVEISFNIEIWPRPSHLFIAHVDKVSEVYREADPIALGDYMEGFDLVSGIRLQDAENLKQVYHRPVISKVVKRRG